MKKIKELTLQGVSLTISADYERGEIQEDNVIVDDSFHEVEDKHVRKTQSKKAKTVRKKEEAKKKKKVIKKCWKEGGEKSGRKNKKAPRQWAKNLCGAEGHVRITEKEEIKQKEIE